MKQNELLLELLNSSDSASGFIGKQIEESPEFISDPLDFILNGIKKDYDIEIKINEKSENALDDTLNELYLSGAYNGFKTGFDLAMILMGYDSVFNIKKEAHSK